MKFLDRLSGATLFATFLILMAGVTYAAIEIGLSLRDFREKTLPQITQVATDADRTAIIVGVTAAHVERMSREWNDQQNQLTRASLQSIESLNSAIVKADVLLSTVSSTVDAQSKSLSYLQGTAADSLLSLKASLSTLNQLTETVRMSIATGSPKLSNTLTNIDLVSQQAAGFASDAHTESSLIVTQTRMAFAPKNKFWTILNASGGSAIKALELWYYWPK